MINWKIYYGDGTTFDNTLGTVNEAPPTGVQVILCLSKVNGRNMYHAWDWYYYNEDGWRGADIYGLLDQLLQDKEGKITAVKQGRTIQDSIYEDILLKAINDEDFPRKIVVNKLDKPKGNGGVNNG